MLLQVEALTAGYGRVPVLHGVDLEVGEGEIVGILGHNGMGKSTLMRCLMGLLPVSGGEIRYAGEVLSALPAHGRARRGLGYVPQGRGILPALTARENLRFAFQDVGRGGEDETLHRTLEQFPRLRPLLGRPGGALSGGEQQLLALARALMGSPDLLLLDEPTEGIQPSIIDEMVDSLERLRREQGLSVLLVEQNVEFIAALADRVLVLEKGLVTGAMTPSELRQSDSVGAFLGFSAAPGARSHPASPVSSSVAAREDGGSLTVFDRPGGRHAPPRSASMPMQAIAPEPRAPAPVTDKETAMTVARPTLEQMREIVVRLGMSMSDQRIGAFMDLMEGYIESYDRVDRMPDYLPEVRYPRTPGHRPDPADNPLNAWYVRCDIKGAPNGPLAGRSIALKDTISLAGVPMMNGASILEGYVPDIDATIVTRMLDAGATIAGKAHCEYLCLSGGSHTNATGPIHNPYKRGYSAGGSSGGSAALVAAGEVDMAIGGDQGGSIRIPASNCGCYGMKATHGLVPYSGVMPIEMTIDHVGPITANVADNALLLEVLAGEDKLDPRQYAPRTARYTEALGRGVHGLRIGVVREGFARPESESDVDAKVRNAADRLAGLGAQVEEISVPLHTAGLDIWTPIALEGLQDLMMHGNAAGTNYRGLFQTGLIDVYANWRNRADELSDSLKLCMLLGEYFLTRYRGRFYAKSQNLARQLRAAYSDVFRRYDLLLMPTLPMKAQPIPPADAPLDLYIQRAFEMIGNTTPFSCTGHPAMNVPCGISEGLPVGMQLVGDYYEEQTLYRAAHAFEQSGDWRAW